MWEALKEITNHFKKRTTQVSEHVEHLVSHREHDSFLIQCLNEAKKELVICSPYIRSAAKDWIPFLSDVKQRGIEITIYSDYGSHFDKEGYYKESSFENVILALIQEGIHPLFIDRMHNKTLWMDETLLVEGSYNWLSAVREPQSNYHNLEASLVYRGEKAKQLISFMNGELKKKPVLKDYKKIFFS